MQLLFKVNMCATVHPLMSYSLRTRQAERELEGPGSAVSALQE